MVTGKDVFITCKEHMPNWHNNYAKGKRNIEVLTDLAELLGAWIEIPDRGTAFKEANVQTFLKTLIKLVEDRGAALDKFYAQKEENLG